MTTLATVLSGSKLYRLDHPGSDLDLKSVHLPALSDCLLMRAPRNVQRKEGEGAAKVEHESFALVEWLKLAANGEDVAVTMLHCQAEDIMVDSPTWTHLRANRSRFYTKHMRGALGYARSQACKHALRADRLEAVERVIAMLEAAQINGVARLGQCWEFLTEGPYVTKRVSEGDRGLDKRVLDVAGKLLPATITPAYGLDILIALRDRYGDRVRAAKAMNGADMKAISHSFRVGYQLRAIFTRGTFSYPLSESAFLRDIKEGRLNYVDDRLDDRLNELITEVEQLAAASSYPEHVDQSWLDGIVLEAYDRVLGTSWAGSS